MSYVNIKKKKNNSIHIPKKRKKKKNNSIRIPEEYMEVEF